MHLRQSQLPQLCCGELGVEACWGAFGGRGCVMACPPPPSSCNLYCVGPWGVYMQSVPFAGLKPHMLAAGLAAAPTHGGGGGGGCWWVHIRTP